MDEPTKFPMRRVGGFEEPEEQRAKIIVFSVVRQQVDAQPSRVTSLLARRLAGVRFHALKIDTLVRSFHERTARLLVTFETTGPFTPVLMEFVTAVKIDGVRYRRFRDECDLCGNDGAGYCAVLSITIDDGALFPAKHSEDIEFVLAVPKP